MKARTRAGTILVGVSIVLFLVLVIEGLLRRPSPASPDSGDYRWFDLGTDLVALLYGVVGGLVVRHLPRNVVGWLLCGMGVIPLLGNIGGALSGRGVAIPLFSDLLNWVFGWYFFAFLGAIVLLIQVFPTGRPLPGWWRVWYRATLACLGALSVAILFGPFDEGVNPYELGPVAEVSGVLWAIGGLGLLLGLATGVVSQGVRFRRAKSRERTQIKWFFFSALVAAGLYFTLSDFSDLLAIATFALPGLAILIALTKHGLFDIDRIVSRTVTYAVVALVVAAIYVVPVLTLPDLLGLSGDVAVAGATLLAAAAFAPLRRRVQGWVDRRFNRTRYDAEQLVAGFAGRLQTGMDLGPLSDELGRVVGVALYPATVSVWLSERVRA